MDIPRFRFAPSPTGNPHVGSLHTALFSWALARAMNGDFILRIDDTDAQRNDMHTMQQMIEALQWLGLDWDEGPDIDGEFGPYKQSERRELHHQIAAKLVEVGAAYYDESDPDAGRPLRLTMPKSGKTILHDALRGDIEFDNRRNSDPIIVRSDGRVLYQLANAADDHAMQITHVVRGDDWISSAPIQIQLYKALGWQEPVWVHVPLILNNKAEKLSKRDPEGGYLVRDFQQAGYLPKALFNYLLLLGWSPDGTQEILSKWDVRKQFRIERLSPSAAQFDWTKLDWLNQQYIKRLSNEQLAVHLREFLEDAYGSLPMHGTWLLQLTQATREELVKLEDIIDIAEWAFDPMPDFVDGAEAVLQDELVKVVLVRLSAEIAQLVLLDHESAENILDGLNRRLKDELDYKTRQIFIPIRVALTGKTSGPPLAAIMGILGKQRCLERLASAIRVTPTR